MQFGFVFILLLPLLCEFETHFPWEWVEVCVCKLHKQSRAIGRFENPGGGKGMQVVTW
jgi:hypothetical protein